MLALLALAAGVVTDFEGGNAGKTEWIAKDHLRVAVQGESDQNKRNRAPNWFYFRVDGVAGRELTIDIGDLYGEYNFVAHKGERYRNNRPVYSYDNREWTNFETADWLQQDSTMRLRLRATGRSVWIARQPPYTTAHLATLLDGISKQPHLHRETVGETVDGRPMQLVTITDPKSAEAGKKVIWVMARQHSWESGTSWVAEGMLRFLVSNSAAAKHIRQSAIFKIFPMADPDGVARGGVRFNKHGYDLNRNWDTVDPKAMPEITSQRKAIFDWVDSGRPVHLFISLHNNDTFDYIQGTAALQEIAERLLKQLAERTTFDDATAARGEPAPRTTAGMPGRMSINQALFHERKIPAFLMELKLDPNPRLGRRPTMNDRMEFGAALAEAMMEAVR